MTVAVEPKGRSMKPDILETIRSHGAKLREIADLHKRIGILLGEVKKARKEVLKLHGALQERQRDYRVMIRKNQLVEAAFLGGKDWLTPHKELMEFKKQCDQKNTTIDEKIKELCSR